MDLAKKSKLILPISLLMLTACKPLEAPIEQVQKALPSENTNEKISIVKGQTATEFICKGDIAIKVQRYQPKKNDNPKPRISGTQAISVTYGNTKHTLSPVVTKNGNKYSNIRWIWFEGLDGIAVLSDNSGNVLASDCKAK
ncbi:GlcNAc transferase [Actinobacillus genomosp. 2]|uniref:GlcNAc transferase n=1 Tax=Actinobacillus genomosp. 2 TaxID=230709 RepID=UPI0024427E88|nr:GlcNAc transferase [Actinobacillus genomosp. 2]WGE31894.1 GlcNAc transferase [Actinobacillus genomosp. 2]